MCEPECVAIKSEALLIESLSASSAGREGGKQARDGGRESVRRSTDRLLLHSRYIEDEPLSFLAAYSSRTAAAGVGTSKISDGMAAVSKRQYREKNQKDTLLFCFSSTQVVIQY